MYTPIPLERTLLGMSAPFCSLPTTASVSLETWYINRRQNGSLLATLTSSVTVKPITREIGHLSCFLITALHSLLGSHGTTSSAQRLTVGLHQSATLLPCRSRTMMGMQLPTSSRSSCNSSLDGQRFCCGEESMTKLFVCLRTLLCLTQ